MLFFGFTRKAPCGYGIEDSGHTFRKMPVSRNAVSRRVVHISAKLCFFCWLLVRYRLCVLVSVEQ